MDVIHVALILALLLLSPAVVHFYRMWLLADRAFQEACTRADWVSGQYDVAMQRFDALVQQNADLAQQLATLRVDKFAVPEQRQFEKREDPEPLPNEIVDILAEIQSPEAREIVEDEVEAMRNAGKSTQEILRRLERGDV